jgi:methionine-S-sulfoxide reductase
MIKSAILLYFSCLLSLPGCMRGNGNTAATQASPLSGVAGKPDDPVGSVLPVGEGLETATFAGGCFWCIDAPFEDLDGVRKVVSGYSGGSVRNPTYEQVSTGFTGHLETVQVTFDPQVISYSEILDVYWREFDPTDADGSFYDRGSQYLSAIFYHTEAQRIIAEATKQFLEKSGVFGGPVVTKIVRFQSPALLQNEFRPVPRVPGRLGEGCLHREDVGEDRVDRVHEAGEGGVEEETDPASIPGDAGRRDREAVRERVR